MSNNFDGLVFVFLFFTFSFYFFVVRIFFSFSPTRCFLLSFSPLLHRIVFETGMLCSLRGCEREKLKLNETYLLIIPFVCPTNSLIINCRNFFVVKTRRKVKVAWRRCWNTIEVSVDIKRFFGKKLSLWREKSLKERMTAWLKVMKELKLQN